MAGFILLAAGIFLGELRLKNRAERRLKEGEIVPLAGGRLLLRRYHNRGAALNLGQGRRKAVAALSVCLTAVLGILFLLSLSRRGNTLLRTGLALLLGGAFSNTYDRLRRGYVVDYFSLGVKWKGLRKIVFNLADFCIFIGALLIVPGAEG